MSTNKKVIVLGATGDQGLPLLDRLRAAGHAVTAAARRPDAFRDTRFADLPVVKAELDDEDGMTRAFEGMDALAMHLPFEFDRAKASAFGARIASAAKRAGVGKIVFHTSCFVADHDLGLSAHDGRRDIEAHIEASGVPFVFVRSVVFMDNMIRIWSKPAIVEKGVFAYPAADTLKISWVCLDDIAAYMVSAVGNDALKADRVLAGVNWPSDVEAGQRLGRKFADYWINQPGNRQAIKDVCCHEWRGVQRRAGASPRSGSGDGPELHPVDPERGGEPGGEPLR